ncbi:Ku protein [Hanamia caeni]|jgi:DNA end-binding protein Ku|uniref:Non-homologous end joining protein Ku n=1 Tax=Hanamia caeni TaxID=2294116 RepID=A0A3M9N4Q7_9BACT|nr:Ku protein [Hanamia caeni]RNI32716.1 Ku protein [Hanamia caeni]
MRAIWTGAIGFGLVNIPVKIYSATESSNLNLDMLDKKDHSKIKYQRVNENTGKEVEWGNIVKGYKIANDYVILDEKDFEAASPEKTKTINITDFVKESEISSLYYETPYYLEPDKSGTRPYKLLLEALEKTKKVGIATFVMRNKEALAVLRPEKNVIVLNKIRFEQEIRDPAELTLPKNTEIKPAELKMAISLIDQLTDKFDISKYKDNYNDELLKIIEAKSKGKKIKAPEMKVVHSKTKDLMEQLKASLDVKRKKAS